jgi:hypothetical protein
MEPLERPPTTALFVAITCVRADPRSGKPGSLFLTRWREIGADKASARGVAASSKRKWTADHAGGSLIGTLLALTGIAGEALPPVRHLAG